jgi:hypothetical protein
MRLLAPSRILLAPLCLLPPITPKHACRQARTMGDYGQHEPHRPTAGN